MIRRGWVKWTLLALLAAPVLLGIGWLGWVMLVMGWELDAHLRIIEDVNNQLGFRYGTPYEDGVEVFVITAVEPNKPMAVAGLQVGDYIRSLGPQGLYHLLIFNQGREIAIAIRRGDQEMEIKLVVPQLLLRDDPSKLHWLL